MGSASMSYQENFKTTDFAIGGLVFYRNDLANSKVKGTLKVQ